MLLLDNMDLPTLREAVRRNDAAGDARAVLEISGGVTLEGLRALAETGVDRISIGALDQGRQGDRFLDAHSRRLENELAAWIDVDYEQPPATHRRRQHGCDTRHAWARVPPEPGRAEREGLKERIRRLLRERDAVVVSHYYVHPDLQDLAEETGGLVSDSLEMARLAATMRRARWWSRACASWARPPRSCRREAVLMPDLDATCSLDLGCPADDFARFCARILTARSWSTPTPAPP